MSVAPFPYAESALAAALGLPRAELTVLRQRILREKKEWGEGSDGSVMLSKKAAEKILGAVGVVDEVGVLLETAAAKELPMVTMKVAQIPINHALVLCDGPVGNRERVWVGRNENFVVGMELQARPYPGQPGVFKLEGPRPRFRGRW